MGDHGVVSSPRSGLEVALEVWHRRKWPALLVFVMVLASSVGASFTLPDMYQSTVTILVEHQQVTGDFAAQSAAATELETRLRTIMQRILSRSHLYDLTIRFNLYPGLRSRATEEEVVERIRRDIRLEFQEVRDPGAWRTATISLNLSYLGRDPETVARVTNALATLYVEENVRLRERQTAGTTEFLRAQLEDARRQLEEQGRQISAFKERHIGELPEQQMVNLAALERLSAKLRVTADLELRAMARRDELAKQLAEFPGAPGDTLPARLARLRAELANLRTRLTDEHPDVVALNAEIAALERQLAVDGSSRAALAGSEARSLGGALAELEAQLTALRNEERTLRSEIATYEQRVANAPRQVQEFDRLSRDYAVLQERYRTLSQRYEDAQVAEQIAQRPQDGEFRILDAAVPPRGPVAPNRPGLLLMGLVLSAGAAVGVVLLTEGRDASFHTVDEVRAVTSVPILVSIPPILTGRDARGRLLRAGLAFFATALCAAAVGGASAYLAHSNEALVRLLTPGRF